MRLSVQPRVAGISSGLPSFLFLASEQNFSRRAAAPHSLLLIFPVSRLLSVHNVRVRFRRENSHKFNPRAPNVPALAHGESKKFWKKL